MKKILITGGAGFIGSHLVESFQGIAEEIRVLDNLKTGKRANLRGLDHRMIVGSITDSEVVRTAIQGVDQVFHCAALSNVPECLDNPAECDRINLQGLVNVLKASEGHGVSNFSFASSASVYGPTPSVPTDEQAPLSPDNPYAQSKADGEVLIADFHSRGRMSAVSLRLFNVYGPRQDPGSGYAAAIPQFISKALRDEEITIYGDGLQTRDFVFVKDVTAAFHHLSTRPHLSSPFNVGGSQAITVTPYLLLP
ncbi:MAG: UDP-glucose 4-epimerase [Akkermansiaceae bacterium]|jgi:UDP-glucose 4-epimerase